MAKIYPHILSVFMNEIQVGELEKTNTGGLIFTYSESWLSLAGARPISLSLPLVTKTFSGDIVYNFFDNLLSDNPQIKSRIQSLFQIPTNHPFDLLASIGKDCVGALQFIHADERMDDISTFSYQTLKEKEIASLLRSISDYPLGMVDRSEDFRISLAGVQEKTALLYWDNAWHRPLGATPTTHIFKLPIGNIRHQHMDLSDSCENEWLCAQIAEAFGFSVAGCEIQYFENQKALVVERFDRRKSKDGNKILRLPQEDMCQALGVSSNLKYQADGGPGIKSIMQLLLDADGPSENRDIFFKTQILFWLLAAIDGHAKNFSIHIYADGRYSLTPLYDIMSAYPLIANKQLQAKKIKMAMALIGKNIHYQWHNMQRRHFLSTAAEANYPIQRAEELLDTMLSQVESVIDRVGNKVVNKIPAKIYEPIFEGMILAKKKLFS